MKYLPLIFLLGCSGTITPLYETTATKFTPEPGIEAYTRKALARWVGASGLNLGISNNGVQIITQADWVIVNGKDNCGRFDYENSKIILSTKQEKCSYWSFESLLLHEIGHSITTVAMHSETGIMAPGGQAENRECIDESSLTLICSGADCSVFEPEC